MDSTGKVGSEKKPILAPTVFDFYTEVSLAVGPSPQLRIHIRIILIVIKRRLNAELKSVTALRKHYARQLIYG